MPKFVKKPVEIEAIQFTGDNYKEIREFTKANSVAVWDGQVVTHLLINTLEGAMKAQVNDWIIRGVKGEYYPCNPDIFEATYDPAPHPAPVTAQEEAFDFAWRVYKETGVTPELRRLYGFYKQAQAEHGDAEPVAWTGSGSLVALSAGHEGFIWPTKADSHPIPLYAHPPQPSETVAAAGIINQWAGMTIRDYFAGQALAWAGNNEWFCQSDASMAERAYRLADAMIAVRKEESDV